MKFNSTVCLEGEEPETLWIALVTLSSGMNIFKAFDTYCQTILQIVPVKMMLNVLKW